MSNAGLEFSTFLNLYELIKLLEYGKKYLDAETYQCVWKNFWKLVRQILLWLFISVALAGCLVFASYQIREQKMDELLQKYQATEWVGGIRVDSTTVQYTKGQSYRYDVSELGLNLDSDFPGQRSLTLLLDDKNQLQGVISDKEFQNVHSIFPYGIVAGMVLAIVIMVIYAIWSRKHSKLAKKWQTYVKWVRTGDYNLIPLLRN